VGGRAGDLAAARPGLEGSQARSKPRR
jgi:hypothetical protein